MMRRAARWGCVLGAVLAVAACGAPGPVEQEFTARYPGLDAQWEQQPYGWEAVVGDGPGFEAEFDAAGRWLETEYELPDGLIFPQAVRDAIARDVPGPIGKWEVEATPAGVFYEVEPAEGDAEYYYDATGARASNENEDA